MTTHEVLTALRKAGHSVAKAMEICLDAKRGDAHAISWLSACGIDWRKVRDSQ